MISTMSRLYRKYASLAIGISAIFIGSFGYALTQTTNCLSLQIPAVGSPNWAPSISQDLEIIDNFACNGGGGAGASGKINPAAQYSFPFYSGTGSTTTLSGLTPGTSGQVLTTAGSSTVPFWSTIPVYTGTNPVIITGTAISLGKISLSTAVVGNLPVTNLNSGSGATSTSFWRGDGSWAVPPGSGSGGSSIYPATATASFPFGFSASTGVFSTSLTVGGQNVCQANGTNCPASGGGASALQVTQNGVQITSPTASINFAGPPFLLGNVSSTATVTLNASSVTLQGQNVIDLTSSLQSGATFYVSSGTVLGTLIVTSPINNISTTPPPVTFNTTYGTGLGAFAGSTWRLNNLYTGSGPQTIFSFANAGTDKVYNAWDSNQDGGNGKGAWLVEAADNLGATPMIVATAGSVTSGSNKVFVGIGGQATKAELEVTPAVGQITPTEVIHGSANSQDIAEWWKNGASVAISSVAANGNMYAPNLTATFGVAGATGTFTNTNIGAINAVVITSTGTGIPLQVIGQGSPGGGVQQRQGYVTIGDDTVGKPVSAQLVLVDSTTDPQVGAGVFEIWEDNPNHNDPIVWVRRNSSTSGPEFRVDGLAPNFETVNTSTANAIGRGKYEIYAQPFQSEILQAPNSRCYDNSSFENEAYWEPRNIQKAVATPGLYMQSQDSTGCDSAIVTSSNTSGVNFFTQNNHTIGLTGPTNVASGSWRWRLPHTLVNTGQVMYEAPVDSFGDYPLEFSSGGSTQQVLTNGGTGAPYWSTISGGGGGGASTLQVTRNGVQITSPTASENFSTDFNLAAIGSTATIAISALNNAITTFGSSVTFTNTNGINAVNFNGNITAGTIEGNTAQLQIYPRLASAGSGNTVAMLDETGIPQLVVQDGSISTNFISASTMTGTSFEATVSSMSEFGSGGLNVRYGVTAGTLTLTGPQTTSGSATFNSTIFQSTTVFGNNSTFPGDWFHITEASATDALINTISLQADANNTLASSGTSRDLIGGEFNATSISSNGWGNLYGITSQATNNSTNTVRNVYGLSATSSNQNHGIINTAYDGIFSNTNFNGSTTTTHYGVYIDNPNLNLGGPISQILNNYGLYVNAQTAGTTSNYGIYSAGGNNMFMGSTTFSGTVNISSGVLLSNSSGSSGQVFTSGGPNTIPTWTTVSGGGGSVGGTINSATQFSSPYYSLMGSSNVLSAFPYMTLSTNTINAISITSNTVISSSNSSNAFAVTATGGNYGTNTPNGAGAEIDCTNTGTNGNCFQIYSHQGTQNQLDAAMSIVLDSNTYNERALYIQQNGTANSPVNGIREDAFDYATLTFEDTRRNANAINGIYQFSDHNDCLRMETRKSGTFEDAFEVCHDTTGVSTGVNSDYGVPVSTFEDAGNLSIGSEGILAPVNGLLVSGNGIFQSSVSVNGANGISTTQLKITNSTSNLIQKSIGMTWDGGGSALTTGTTYWVVAPASGTINKMILTANPSGSFSVIVSSSASFGLSNAGKICSSDCPTINSGTVATDTTLTGWTTAVAKDEFLYFVSTAAVTATQANLTIEYTLTTP